MNENASYVKKGDLKIESGLECLKKKGIKLCHRQDNLAIQLAYLSLFFFAFDPIKPAKSNIVYARSVRREKAPL
jgi:hypothetical protein